MHVRSYERTAYEGDQIRWLLLPRKHRSRGQCGRSIPDMVAVLQNEI